MWRFENDRIKKFNVCSKSFKAEIPAVCVEPLQKTDNSVVFIFSGGLGATNDGNLFMNNPIYNEHYFVTFEKAGQGLNVNKPSQFRKNWLIELDEIVEWVKANIPNKKIYLLGESWGAAVTLIYYIKNKSKVAGAAIWNMPTKPIDPDSKKKTFSEKWSTAVRQLGAIIFNRPIKLKSTNKNYGTLSTNTVLIRAMNVAEENRQNALLTAAVWRFMGVSRRALLKYGSNPEYNFIYIQSNNDAMFDRKMLPKYEKKLDSNHFVFLPSGYHVLSFEPKECNDLYKVVESFIKK